MYKFIKAFFVATVVLLAVGTPPMAKASDVHNKAPGIVKATEVSVLEVTITPVVYEELSAFVSPADHSPQFKEAVFNYVKNTETSFNLGAIKPPGERWCKVNGYPTKTKRPMYKWKDIHRRQEIKYV